MGLTQRKSFVVLQTTFSAEYGARACLTKAVVLVRAQENFLATSESGDIARNSLLA